MFYQHFGEEWMQLTLDYDGWNERFTSWLEWRKGVFNKQRRGQRDNKFSFIRALEGLGIGEREGCDARLDEYLMLDETDESMSSSSSDSSDSTSSTSSS